MHDWKQKLPGIIITAVLFVAALFFVILLAGSGLLPTQILLLLAAALLCYTAGAGILLWNVSRRVRFGVGAALSALMVAGIAAASVYVCRTVDMLNRTTNVRTQTTVVGVFVRADDPADSVADLTGANFGILTSLDRANTDTVLQEMSSKMSDAPTVHEYDGITQLIDSLITDKETDAVIFNLAYLDLLADIEGYENIENLIRQIDTHKVETVLREPVEVTPDPEAPFVGKSYTIYISGSDTRQGLNTIGRSDVNILATVNTATKQILLVTTPRDYYVPLSISGGVPDKLTHAGIYGIDVSIETLEMLYDINIDYFFRVNFTGFIDVVDALGGINVYSDYAFTSRDGYYYDQGWNTIDGAEALSFARERHAFAVGDEQRGRDQMRVISAIIDKAVSPDILTNYMSIIESLEGSFEMNIPYNEIASVVREQLSSGGAWNVIRYGVSGYGDSAIPYSMPGQYAYVMRPDFSTVAKAQDLMARVKNGEILTQEDTESTENIPPYHGDGISTSYGGYGDTSYDDSDDSSDEYDPSEDTEPSQEYDPSEDSEPSEEYDPLEGDEPSEDPEPSKAYDPSEDSDPSEDTGEQEDGEPEQGEDDTSGGTEEISEEPAPPEDDIPQDDGEAGSDEEAAA